MSDNQDQQNQQSQQNQQGGQGQEQQDQVIQIKAGLYNQLLDRLDYLEGQVAGKGQSPKEGQNDLDDLADRGQQQQKRQQRQQDDDQMPNFDQMTPTEMASTIFQGIHANFIQPLMVQLEEIRYAAEIDRLSRQEGFEDLMAYQDELVRHISQNPKLSLKQAYTLAKQENPDKGKKTQEAQKAQEKVPPKTSDILKTLQATGNRSPAIPRGVTRENEPDDLQGAAESAYDEVFTDET